MNDDAIFLSPIEVETPPYNTKIHWPRCFTCEHFPICTDLRSDYLKTCLLIEQILGNPQEDRELVKAPRDVNCGCYKGMPIENPEEIFPQTLVFTKRTLPDKTVLTEPVEGKLESAVYQDFNTVLFKYNSEGFIIVFKANYKQDLGEFEILDGTEVVYGIIYEFPADSVLEVQVNLDSWQEKMKEAEESSEVDIINTTYFSAQLNCNFYKPIKNLKPEEGMKRIIAKYPDGVPCGDGLYYHLETLHIEPHKTAWYNPNAGQVAFAPMPYPVFVPKPCKPKKVYRRDDLTDENF